MGAINTEYLEKSLKTLEKSYVLIQTVDEDSIDYEMYRNALVKGFEMTLEQSGNLLKKRLAPYFSSKKAVDTLAFKDLFREAHKHSLMDEQAVQRWFKYRDNRNNTAHDYGVNFAEQTLSLMDDFILDVQALQKALELSTNNKDNKDNKDA